MSTNTLKLAFGLMITTLSCRKEVVSSVTPESQRKWTVVEGGGEGLGHSYLDPLFGAKTQFGIKHI